MFLADGPTLKFKSDQMLDNQIIKIHHADEPVDNFQNSIPITILPRPHTLVENKKNHSVLYPKLPYHKRCELYYQKRDEIFNVSEVSTCTQRKTKRSTLRMRNFYKIKGMCRRLLISTIISNPTDMRYYAKVKFLNFIEYGLLDTGANISCIGAELAKHDFSKYDTFTKCKSSVKTADGQTQNVVGWVYVDIHFRDKFKSIQLFIIPTISQKLILGIDFWKAFDLIPDILNSVDLVASDGKSNTIC